MIFALYLFTYHTNIFTLTRQEREVAYKMAINLQLESYFRVDSIPDAVE